MGGDAKDQVDLVKKGFKRQASWPALGYAIWPNTANPNSKWKDKRLREAIEYALDKDAIAKALGFGLYKPLKSLPPEGEWGYDPNYNPRPYNPAKAKELLAAAGYANGLKAKLLVFFTPDWKDAGTAIKQYLDAAGFQITWTSPTRGGSSAPYTTRHPARISTYHSGSPAGTRITL